MEIVTNVGTINAIFKMAKQFIGKKDNRPITQNITLVVEDDTLTASAINGMSLGVIKFYKVGIDDCKMAIPLLPLFKDKPDMFCRITQTDTDTVFETPSGKQSVPRTDAGQLIEYERYLPKKTELKETCYFSADLLITALKAFSGAVKIEYYGQKTGIVIYSENKTALVLPVAKYEGE